MKVLVCGGGNMGEAMARSLLQQGLCSCTELLIVERRLERCEELERLIDCQVCSEFSRDVGKPDVVLLVVKPQDVESLCCDLLPFLEKDVLVISAMAGVSLDRLRALLNGHHKIIRAMPNLPFLVGQGMTVYFGSDQLTSEIFALADSIFNSGGKTLRVEREELLDAATAISGSGPGYLYNLLEQFEIVAQQLGFSGIESALLIKQTCFGAMDYWEKTGCDVKTLKERVASKGGTTEAAFDILAAGRWAEVFREAVVKAFKRSQELSH